MKWTPHVEAKSSDSFQKNTFIPYILYVTCQQGWDLFQLKNEERKNVKESLKGFCWVVSGYCQVHFSDCKKVFLSAGFCWVVSGSYCRCNWRGNEQSLMLHQKFRPAKLYFLSLAKCKYKIEIK